MPTRDEILTQFYLDTLRHPTPSRFFTCFCCGEVLCEMPVKGIPHTFTLQHYELKTDKGIYYYPYWENINPESRNSYYSIPAFTNERHLVEDSAT
jgi:hypothetical protein